jgi:hypothetical protein
MLLERGYELEEPVTPAIEALRDIHDYLVNRPCAAGVAAARR